MQDCCHAPVPWGWRRRGRGLLGDACEFDFRFDCLAVWGGELDVAIEVIAVEDEGAFVNGAVIGRLDLEGDLVAIDGAFESGPLSGGIGSAGTGEFSAALGQNEVGRATVARLGGEGAAPFSADIGSSGEEWYGKA